MNDNIKENELFERWTRCGDFDVVHATTKSYYYVYYSFSGIRRCEVFETLCEAEKFVEDKKSEFIKMGEKIF